MSDPIIPKTHLGVARLVLETQTPLSIASGQSGAGLLDVALVRDANGLPMVPGTSIAGVLRSLHRRLHPADADVRGSTDFLFGYQAADDAQPSRVSVSHGVLLDSHGQPVQGLLLGEARQRLESDPLLRRAAEVDAAVVRDRVRIAARGAGADRGLFDRTILPAGYRFAVEVSLWMGADGTAEWNELLALFGHPLFRLGGGTHAGLGACRVVRAQQRVFALDLRNDGVRKDIEDFATLGAGLAASPALAEHELPSVSDPNLVAAELKLEPHHFWAISNGTTPVGKSTGKAPDRLPKTEPRVRWSGGQGELVEKDTVLVPASSIKGVLAHRVTFHANRRAGVWADEVVVANGKTETSGIAWNYDARSEPEHPATLLFGSANDDTDEAKAERRRQVGRVIFDDVWLDPAQLRAETLTHNAIDRFSGGVREHLLFQEQVLVGGTIPLHFYVDLAGLDADQARTALTAFMDALRDLNRGRLALGSRASTGHGAMSCTLKWQSPPAVCGATLTDLEARA